MIDRSVLAIGGALTAAAAFVALMLVRNPSDLLLAMSIFPAWMAATALLGVIGGFVALVRTGTEHPTRAAVQFVRRQWRAIGSVSLLMALAGMNLITYMWAKPLLNQHVPFRAGPFLAATDHILFLGHDPWRLVQWANVPGTEAIYHPLWFAVIMVTLLALAVARPSTGKSALLTTYFVLWTITGPLIHCLLPAAGPLFYQKLGYGDRFADLPRSAETQAMADYLWQFYEHGSFGPGNGISAMPSMHVVMMSWVVLVAAVTNRRLLPAALAMWSTTFVLSIALGWHYAMDGVVGVAAAAATYAIVLGLYRRGQAITARRPAAAITV